MRSRMANTISVVLEKPTLRRALIPRILISTRCAVVGPERQEVVQVPVEDGHDRTFGQ